MGDCDFLFGLIAGLIASTMNVWLTPKPLIGIGLLMLAVAAFGLGRCAR